MKTYGHVLARAYAQIWFIEQDKLVAAFDFLELKADGQIPEPQTLAAIHAASELSAARSRRASAVSESGAVAVLPLYGLLMQRGNMMGDISGPRGTSYEQFKQQFRQAVADPGIKHIVIDVDSPGGAVAGCEELAGEIYAARGKKPITAVANCLMASAAYYVACAADELVASPSSQVGSIGVYAAMRDESAALEKAGIKYTLVTYGENKAEGDPRVPITPEAVANLQKMVTHAGQMFDKAVARGRGVTAARVRETYGQGRTFMAAEALQLGMVDRVATLDEVLAGLGVGSTSAARAPLSGEAAGAELNAAANGAPKADAEDGMSCECPCAGCAAGDCDSCDTDDCGYAGCGCSAAQAKQKAVAQAAIDRAAMSRRARIAAV